MKVDFLRISHPPAAARRIGPRIHRRGWKTLGARLCLAGVLLAVATPPMVRAQSPGIAALTQGSRGGASRVADGGRERHAKREARGRGQKLRGESRESAERAVRGNNSRLTTDERRRLRQNLYDLSREMYRGG